MLIFRHRTEYPEWSTVCTCVRRSHADLVNAALCGMLDTREMANKELKQRLERELLEAREAGVVASARANEMEKDVRAAKEGWEQARSEGSRNADDLSSQVCPGSCLVP